MIGEVLFTEMFIWFFGILPGDLQLLLVILQLCQILGNFFPRLSFFHEFFSNNPSKEQLNATPLRGTGKIFRPFFSKRQKQRTNEQMVRLALFPRLSFFSRLASRLFKSDRLP